MRVLVVALALAAVGGANPLLSTVALRAKVEGLPAQSPPPAVVWDVDNLSKIGGNAVEVIGAPKVVSSDAGQAVAFNGTSDGLLVNGNPLAGLSRFTLEVLFSP